VLYSITDEFLFCKIKKKVAAVDILSKICLNKAKEFQPNSQILLSKIIAFHEIGRQAGGTLYFLLQALLKLVKMPSFPVILANVM